MDEARAAGHVELKLIWRDGTTHLVMLPPELMRRLAARIPRPRLLPRVTASQLSISVVGRPMRRMGKFGAANSRPAIEKILSHLGLAHLPARLIPACQAGLEMIPDAFEAAHDAAGPIAVLGFVAAFVRSKLGG